MTAITNRYIKMKASLPNHVKMVLAVKTRTPEEVLEVIHAGATDLGHNYIQEADTMIAALGADATRVNWHLIGHLQKNKINRALSLFDTLQTIDSIEKARAVNLRAERMGQIQSCLIEINSGSEEAKSGVAPVEETLEALCREMVGMKFLKLNGLMTMGPAWDDPEKNRPYFRRTRELGTYIQSLALPHVAMTEFSMGMSHSYTVAIEEGATMIRPGSSIFGNRF